jgi:hypothetical protein
MPRIGATPPLHEWTAAEIALDLTNAAIFAVAVDAVLAMQRS